MSKRAIDLAWNRALAPVGTEPSPFHGRPRDPADVGRALSSS